jgi:hypothetical protein
MLEICAADRLVVYLRVSTGRRVLGCLFWTFEFPILDLFRISDFEIRFFFSPLFTAGARFRILAGSLVGESLVDCGWI